MSAMLPPIIVPVWLLQILEGLKCKHVLADDREARQKPNDMRNAKCAPESPVCHFDTKQWNRKTAPVVRSAMVLLAFSRWSPTMQRSMTSTCMRIHIFLGTASAFSASILFSSRSSSPPSSRVIITMLRKFLYERQSSLNNGQRGPGYSRSWVFTVHVGPCCYEVWIGQRLTAY
jgi:hypothetical protein